MVRFQIFRDKLCPISTEDMVKLPTCLQSYSVDKVTVLLGVSVNHAKKVIRSTSHLYRLLLLFTSECTIFSTPTALSMERPDSQISHWPAQVVSKGLCISISISAPHSQTETDQGYMQYAYKADSLLFR
jgi:hypothetical protein